MRTQSTERDGSNNHERRVHAILGPTVRIGETDSGQTSVACAAPAQRQDSELRAVPASPRDRVRCGYQDEDNLLWSQVVKPPDDGRALAAEWRQMVIEKGYEELTF
jgi:hypothetical protein